MRIGVVYWGQLGELPLALSSTLESFGHEVINFRHDAALPDDLDVVVALGPFGSLVPLSTQLLAQPAPRRPGFVLWMTEQLWNPKLPTWLGRAIGETRSLGERLALRQRPNQPMTAPRWRWLTSRGFRFRYYGDLHWLRRQGLLTVLAVPSKWTANFLSARGFDVTLAYLGSHPSWQADLGLERDVPALWLGSMGSTYRRGAVHRLRQDLRDRGVELMIVDGVELAPVFGAARTHLLNRTKVVVNLVRKPWDSNALRYYLAAPNRALIVSEPTLAHTPFVPGVHLLQVPREQMAETICYYLSNEEARQRIAAQAYRLVTTELTMANSVASILERLAQVR
jgi:hypothetical protein